MSIGPSTLEECSNGPIQLRTIVRSAQAIWFFILRKNDALGIPFYTIEIAGINW